MGTNQLELIPGHLEQKTTLKSQKTCFLMESWSIAQGHVLLFDDTSVSLTENHLKMATKCPSNGFKNKQSSLFSMCGEITYDICDSIASCAPAYWCLEDRGG